MIPTFYYNTKIVPASEEACTYFDNVQHKVNILSSFLSPDFARCIYSVLEGPDVRPTRQPSTRFQILLFTLLKRVHNTCSALE